MKKKTIILLLILILLLTGVPLGAAAAEGDPGTFSIETEPAAQNLTGRCQVTSDLKTTAYTWRVSFFGPIEWTGGEESEPEQEGAADGQD